jgi:hypothetical protein
MIVRGRDVGLLREIKLGRVASFSLLGGSEFGI